MKTAITFEAQARENIGKGASRELRRSGRIPAVLYGKDQAPMGFSLDANAFSLFFHKGGVMNKLVDITVNGKQYHALPREVQLHPVSDVPLHVDFLKVDENSRVNVFVPVIVLNTDKCIGVKRGGAVNIVRHEIELVCKPDSIPNAIKLDITEMKIGDSLHISAVKLPEDVVPAIRDRDFTIITVAGRNTKEDDAAAAEGAAAGAAASAAGKAPAGKAAAPAAKAPAKPAAKK